MNFYNLLFSMGIGSCCFLSENLEMFDELPVELVILILSYLDVKSLVVMSRMNKRLFNICKSNKQLRTAIRRQLRKELKEHLKKMLNPIKVTVLRSQVEANSAFQSRNARKELIIRREFDHSKQHSTVHETRRNVTHKRKAVCQEKKSESSKRLRI